MIAPRHLRRLGLPTADPRDRWARPPAVRDPALWLVALILGLELLAWSDPALRRDATAALGLIPAKTFGLMDFAGFPVSRWLEACGAGQPTALCQSLAAWQAAPAPAEPHRLFTYASVHADPLHAGVNAAALLYLARPLYGRLGGWRFLLFFLLAAAAGGVSVLVLDHLPDLYWHRQGGPASLSQFPGVSGTVPVVGASGAIFGLWLAGLRADWDRLRHLPRRLRRHSANRVLAVAATVGLGLNLAMMALPIGVSGEAHLGGAVFGFFCLPLFQRPSLHAARRGERRRSKRMGRRDG